MAPGDRGGEKVQKKGGRGGKRFLSKMGIGTQALRIRLEICIV